MEFEVKNYVVKVRFEKFFKMHPEFNSINSYLQEAIIHEFDKMYEYGRADGFADGIRSVNSESEYNEFGIDTRTGENFNKV